MSKKFTAKELEAIAEKKMEQFQKTGVYFYGYEVNQRSQKIEFGVDPDVIGHFFDYQSRADETPQDDIKLIYKEMTYFTHRAKDVTFKVERV